MIQVLLSRVVSPLCLINKETAMINETEQAILQGSDGEVVVLHFDLANTLNPKSTKPFVAVRSSMP